MADTLRYLSNTAEATSYQPEPLGAVTAAKLTTACDVAEDEVDKYLANRGLSTPITIDDLDDTQQDILKRAVAMMVAAVLFEQHSNTIEQGNIWRRRAERKLDDLVAHANLGHTTVQRRLGVVNWQEEYVTVIQQFNDDWGW